MGRIGFGDVDKVAQQNQTGGGFFSLANDGDVAIVRFLIETVEDVEVVTVHDVTVGGKYRKVLCPRDIEDGPDACPLCAAGIDKQKVKLYIHMLQYDYTVNATGERVPTGTYSHKVWEKGPAYKDELMGYINRYKPLHNKVFEIERHGKKGDMKTAYQHFVTDYTTAECPYDPAKDFEEVKSVVGTIVLDKTVDEINTFIATGEFPETGVIARQSAPAQPAAQAAPAAQPRPTYTAPAQPAQEEARRAPIGRRGF